MSFDHIISIGCQAAGENIAQSDTQTADAEDNRDIVVADPETDFEVAMVFAVADLKSVYIDSDAEITLETNNGAAPADTFTIKPGAPLSWNLLSPLPNPFGTDVTALFITNTIDGKAANVRIRVLKDSTP